VAQYIQENLRQELRLAAVSAVVNMSPYHFARLFISAPPACLRIDSLVPHRIDEARTLLPARTMPIAEVARAWVFGRESLHDDVSACHRDDAERVSQPVRGRRTPERVDVGDARNRRPAAGSVVL